MTGKQKQPLVICPPQAKGEVEGAGYCLGLHSKEEAPLSPSDRYSGLIKRGSDKTMHYACTPSSTRTVLSPTSGPIILLNTQVAFSPEDPLPLAQEHRHPSEALGTNPRQDPWLSKARK